MIRKLYLLLLIITSLFGYLEWGGNNHMFLFQAERDIFSKLFADPVAVLHPFTVLPFLGQIILLISLFQKYPSKTWVYTGVGFLGILLGLMLLIGLISTNYKVILSTIPFLTVSVCTILQFRKTGST
jgi:hypothetical protein